MLFKTTELIYSLEEKRNAWLKLQVRISHAVIVDDYVDDEAEILPEVMCRRQYYIQGHQEDLKEGKESKDSRWTMTTP